MKTEEKTVLDNMINYFASDAKRIQHFIKVHAFCMIIAERECLPEDSRYVLSLAAFCHDIGIKQAEEDYHSTAGSYQEKLGAPLAEKMLEKCGIERQVIDRVVYIVGNHHTYSKINTLEFQILAESDCIVNSLDDGYSLNAVKNLYKNVFKTDYGKFILKTSFGF